MQTYKIYYLFTSTQKEYWEQNKNVYFVAESCHLEGPSVPECIFAAWASGNWKDDNCGGNHLTGSQTRIKDSCMCCIQYCRRQYCRKTFSLQVLQHHCSGRNLCSIIYVIVITDIFLLCLINQLGNATCNYVRNKDRKFFLLQVDLEQHFHFPITLTFIVLGFCLIGLGGLVYNIKDTMTSYEILVAGL